MPAAPPSPVGLNIPPPHNIGSMIDESISATPSTYQFPEDRPKYYTVMSFEKFVGGQGAGGYRDTAQRGIDALKSKIQNLPNTAIPGMTTADGKPATVRSLMADQLQTFINDVNTGFPQSATNPALQQGDAIILPLPMGLSDVHKVHWDEKPIVPWVSAISGILSLGGTSPVQAATGLFGLAPNYFYTMLFDRPEYKRHEIVFKLSPRNFRESTAIRDIIWVLNNAMSPGLEYGGLLFSFPNIVNVTLKPNNGWLFKFKPCVIETMAINYAGGEGKKAFYHDQSGTYPGDNPPESVEVTLHLCELEYWIRDQFTLAND